MDRAQLIEFISILGVEYQLDDFKHDKIKDIVISCPFAQWHHKFGVDKHLGNASIRVGKLPHLFHCFTCKQGGGTLPSMIRALRTDGFSSEKCDKLLELASTDSLDFNMTDKFSFEPDDDKFDVIRMNAYEHPSSAVYSYMLFRDLPFELIDKFEIALWRDYMTLPMRNFNNEIVGVAKRLLFDIPKLKRWIYETTSKAEMCLYGENFMVGGDDAILVEGQVDVLYLDGLIPGVIPLGANGSDLSDYQVSALKRLGSLTLMVDNDAGGEKLKKKTISELSEYIPLMFEAEIPAEYNDPAATPKSVLKECFDNRVVIRRKTHGKKLVGRRNSGRGR